MNPQLFKYNYVKLTRHAQIFNHCSHFHNLRIMRILPQKIFQIIFGGCLRIRNENRKQKSAHIKHKMWKFSFLKISEKMEIFSSELVAKLLTLRKKFHQNLEIKALIVRTIRTLISNCS